MLVRLSTITERLRASLFFVPMVFVVAALGLAIAGITIDVRLLDDGTDLPSWMTSTVDSARSVLSTVAGATITFAGIAFSVSLLLIQQASSQFSPRVIQGLFRDPFNKRVMGIVVGTFTYCLIVLRSVRGPLEQDGTPVIPNLSVAFAVLLGVISILAIVAFISHSAHSMDISKILHNVTEDALDEVRRYWVRPDDEVADDASAVVVPEQRTVITFEQHGWIQAVDLGGLARVAPDGGTVQLETAVGRYAIAGAPLCTVWPPPADVESASRMAHSAVGIGETRTSRQDVTYGLRQLADVALKALSPGINDPTTAQDAMFHLGSVLRELLVRRSPSARQTIDGRSLIQAEQPTHDDLVGLAFDEVRIASATQPTMLIYLLEILHLLDQSLVEHGRTDERLPLRRQADLILESVSGDAVPDTDLTPADADRVVAAHHARFPDDN